MNRSQLLFSKSLAARACSALIVFAVASGLPASATLNGPGNVYFQQYQNTDFKDIEARLNAITKATQVEPSDWQYHSLRATELNKLGRYSEAKTECDMALQCIQESIAQSQQTARQFPERAPMLNHLIDTFLTHSWPEEIHATRAQANLAMKNYEEAIRDQDEVVKIGTPGNHGYYLEQKAMMEEQAGNLSAAAKDMESAIDFYTSKPRSATDITMMAKNLREHRAGVLDKLGQPRQASVEYTRLLGSIDGTSDRFGFERAKYLALRAAAYDKSGNQLACLSDLNALIAESKNNNPYDAVSKRAHYYERQGMLTQAEDDFNKLVSLQPYNGYCERGAYFERNGSLDKADADFSKASQSAFSVEPVLACAQYAVRRGRINDAETLFQKALSNWPEHPYTAKGDPHMDRARFYIDDQQWQKAKSDLDFVIDEADKFIIKEQQEAEKWTWKKLPPGKLSDNQLIKQECLLARSNCNRHLLFAADADADLESAKALGDTTQAEEFWKEPVAEVAAVNAKTKTAKSRLAHDSSGTSSKASEAGKELAETASAKPANTLALALPSQERAPAQPSSTSAVTKEPETKSPADITEADLFATPSALSVPNEEADKVKFKAVIRYNLGVREETSQNTPKAIIYYKSACDLLPDFFDAHYRLAVIYKQQKENADALAQVKECLRITPSDARAQKLSSLLN